MNGTSYKPLRFMPPCGMPLKDPSFTIGIEEEYLLVDQASRDLVREMPQALFEAAQQACWGRWRANS